MCNELIPGFNDAKEILIAQLMEPLDQYILCQLKLQQLKMKGIEGPAFEITRLMMEHKDQIAEILVQNIDLK